MSDYLKPGEEPALFARPVKRAASDAQFETRRYSLFQRTYMAVFDLVIFGVIGTGLRLGGRPLQRLLCWVIGRTLYWTMPRRTHVAMVNLDLAFGDEKSEADKRRIARAMYVHFVRLAMDVIWDTVYWSPRQIQRRVNLRGSEVLARALESGVGWCGVASHLGNWELMCTTACAQGFDFTGVFKSARIAYVDRFVGRKRLRSGMHLIEVPHSEYEVVDGERRKKPRRSIRPQIESTWAGNRGIGFLCDQYPGSGGLPLPFLGVPDVPTHPGMPRYALDNGVPFTLCVTVYNDEGGADWIVRGPVYPEQKPGGPDETLRYYTTLFNAWHGEMIRRYPEQYAWGHRRFPRHYYKQPRPVRPDASDSPIHEAAIAEAMGHLPD